MYHVEPNEGMQLTYIALYGETPIGACTLELNGGILQGLGPWIGDLVVAPKYQKQGVGKMLLDVTIRKAKELGFERLYLFTFDPTILAYYHRFGWNIMGTNEFKSHIVANVVNRHETWFQALVTFDMEVHMGSFKPKNVSRMPPTMHIISAYWRTAFSWMNLHYRLNKNGYLVTLSPTSKDKHYSYHMNFTDLSTLQYLPVYQASLAHDHSKLSIREDLIIRTDDKKFELRKVNRPTYLIVKNDHSWEITYHELKKDPVIVSLDAIPGLQLALDHLSKTSPNESELTSIKKMVHAWHHRFGNFLGHGNGFQITQALNFYLLDFFNAYLKNESNPFVDCIPLTTNTYLKCGPGAF